MALQSRPLGASRGRILLLELVRRRRHKSISPQRPSLSSPVSGGEPSRRPHLETPPAFSPRRQERRLRGAKPHSRPRARRAAEPYPEPEWREFRRSRPSDRNRNFSNVQPRSPVRATGLLSRTRLCSPRLNPAPAVRAGSAVELPRNQCQWPDLSDLKQVRGRSHRAAVKLPTRQRRQAAAPRDATPHAPAQRLRAPPPSTHHRPA